MRKRAQGASAPGSSPLSLDMLLAERENLLKQLEQAKAQMFALTGALQFCEHAINLASGKVPNVQPQPGTGALGAAAEASAGADSRPAALNGSGAPVATQ